VASSEELRLGVASAIEPYHPLLERFVAGGLGADDFDAQYLDLYLHDESVFPDEVFEVVDAFFAEAEAYEPDPELRAQLRRAIGPDVLKKHAAELLRAAGYEVEPSPA
jgi:hypothetical protein